jgi:predicted RNA methylase
MAIVKDPEGKETAALNAMVEFKDRSVLEIGCGDGRLTWRYAANTARVVAIDPDGERIESARANMPDTLRGRVYFTKSSLAEYASTCDDRKFDIALFSWSL